MGPAPTSAPRSNASRNIAKFSDTRPAPNAVARSASDATMSSTSPLSAVGSRRIRSSDTPVRPHGTKLRNARSCPSPSCASTSTQSASSWSPSRPSAIEKPRSSPPSPRHCAAAASSAANCAASRDPCLVTRVVYPLRCSRVTDCRTAFIPGPVSENVRMSRIASSPISHAVSPASVYASAPVVPAPMTASDQPLSRACRRHCSIAAGQCSGSPTGLPLARLTDPTTRYDTPARAVAASPDSHTTDLSRRVAK